MQRHIAEFIDDYRIWFKVSFQRGRILKTRGDAWQDYDSPRHYADPRNFYCADGQVPEVSLRHGRGTGLADVSAFSFPSLHPIRGYPYGETNLASGLLYRVKGRDSAPVIILSHGWAHDRVRGLEVVYIRPLLEAGFSVALLAHPLHFERTPAGTYSGEMMVSGDVVLTVEAFRQSVADIIGLANWLRGSGAAPRGRVGLLGYSLGGYTAALAACVRDDFDFVVVAAAGDSLVSVILDTGLGVNVREDLSLSGMHHRENLRRAWGIISPGRLKPRMPKERLLLVAGAYDRIMLRRSVEALWEEWERPPILWDRQGHYSLLAMPGRLVRRCLPFMKEHV